MPVTLPSNESPLTVDDIRLFLRDQPDYNPLLDDVEFKNSDIERAMRLTVAKYNVITPQTSLTSYAQLNEWLLLCGVCCILFRSEGARQLRNQVTAQDGNIAPVGLDEKQSLYAQWADRFCAEFDQLAKQAKIQNNMESIYSNSGGAGGGSGFGSGYRYIGKWTVR